MTGEATSSYRCTSWLISGMENIKYEDLVQTGEHSRDVYQPFKNTLTPHLLLSRVEMEKMADRSKEVKSESSSYEKSKSAPASLSELCELLRDRITQKSQLYRICHEDQQALTEVLTAELGLIWQDLKAPFVDTTLTQEENLRLRSQIFCEVLHICEELLLQYLLLMDTFRRRGIFTDYANRSRLVARLASDCTNLLNVRSIRCRIVSGIKATRRVKSGAEASREEQQRAPHRNMLTSPYKRDPHVKNCMTNTLWQKTVIEELKEIEESIGELDLQRVYDLLPCHVEPVTYKTDTSCKASLTSMQTQEKSHNQNQHVRIKGCHSMPDLQRETLLEELEIAPPSRSPSLLVLLSTESSSSLDDHINPTEDLKRLLEDNDCEDDTDFETDLSSLIKASSSRSSNRLQKLKQRLQKMEEEEKEEKRKNKDLAETPPHPQGANVRVVVSPQMFVHTATARVSDRVLHEHIKLNMYPPVYNPFTKEIDWASLTRMDQNLVEENMGIKEVFEELSKSISTKYFNFDEDPIFEPVPTKATFCPKRSNNKHLFNPSLMKPNPYSISHRERMEMVSNRPRPVDVTTRAYRAWFKWWTCQLSVDDYLNYISSQDSDYLSVMFHLYDSDDEEEKERHRLTQQKKERTRRQQERINSLRKLKQEYVPGFWNVNTIEMGGLGKDPDLEEENSDEESQDVVDEGPAAGLLDGEQVQARLERVWNDLCLPGGQRLDMAIKYSSHEYRDHLQEALGLWEQAAQLIHQRELLLYKLEEFEREASDPKRFFQQGYHGSSSARMEEASRREKINSRISVADKELAKTIGYISTRFNDIITYKGRPYREKMRWDRVEMLYWLQQERRVQSLERFVQGQTVLPARLPPLHHDQEL